MTRTRKKKHLKRPRRLSKEPSRGKGRTGFGGIRCACCTKGTPHEVKQYSNRWIRHQKLEEVV